MFSQTAEYALRAVTWLADHHDECPAGVAIIAASTQVPSSYLAKVLQQLAHRDIVVSRRGVGGGFSLARDADRLTVLEVVNSVDPLARFDDCPLKLRTHRHTRCPMHAKLNDAIDQVSLVLSKTTISELLRDPSRPKPMVDQS